MAVDTLQPHEVAGSPPWPALVDAAAVRGRTAAIDARTLGGADVLDAYRSGAFLPLPISHLLGMVLTGVGEGKVTAMLPASHWLMSSRGLVPAAVIPLVADLATNASVHNAAPAERLLVTVRISLDFRTCGVAAGGMIVATARPTTVTRSAVSTTVAVRDATGLVLCEGGTCDAILPSTADVSDSLAIARGETHAVVALLTAASKRAAFATPHPFSRPPIGETLPPSVWLPRRGLDVLMARIAGALPQPPICHLMDLRPVEAGEGWSRWCMPASPCFEAVLPGRLYGGSVVFLLGMALEGTVETVTPAGATPWLTRVSARLLRPIALDDTPLVAHAVVVRRDGQRVTLRSELIDRAGQVAATATGIGEFRRAGDAQASRPSSGARS
jgi:acyl-coenzyme A thioesterase PaaI-like protein